MVIPSAAESVLEQVDVYGSGGPPSGMTLRSLVYDINVVQFLPGTP
jgi:hypothetical protein